jgi:hypothetical protein
VAAEAIAMRSFWKAMARGNEERRPERRREGERKI